MRLHAALSKIAATDAANPILFANPIIFPLPGANMPACVTSGKKKSKPGISPSGMRSISIVTSTSLIWWADAAICRWTRRGIELRAEAMLGPSLMTAKTRQPVACGVGDLGWPSRLIEPAWASGGPGPSQTAWRGRQNTLSVIGFAPVAQR